MKYEFKAIPLGPSDTIGKIEVYLNKLGVEGWMIAGVGSFDGGGQIIYLQRLIPSLSHT